MATQTEIRKINGKKRTVWKTRLPSARKPWELIRLAIKDLIRSERDPTVAVEMGAWHDKAFAWNDPERKCEVCFAGAVMAQTCRIPNEISVSPSSFDRSSERKFQALNAIRLGEMDEFYEWLCIKKPETLDYFYNVVDYHADPTEFKKQMRALAAMIKRAHKGQPAKLIR